MPFTIDHIVIAVADLDRATRDYEVLGFTVLPGGEHPRGSRNALVVLADGAYLEIIAFPKPVPGFRWWEVFAAAGPGFVDYALLPDDFEVDIARQRVEHLHAAPIGVEVGRGPMRPVVERLDEAEVIPGPVLEHGERMPRLEVLDGLVALRHVARTNPDVTTEVVPAASVATPDVVGRTRSMAG